MKGIDGMMKNFKNNTVIVAAAALSMAMLLTACSGNEGPKNSISDGSNEAAEGIDMGDKNDVSATADINADIDLDSLNKSVENIKNLDLGVGAGSGSSAGSDSSAESDSTEASDNTDTTDDTAADGSAAEPAGDKTVYSYVDVYRNGNDLTLVPNGGMNASTVLYGGKDLKGFLDYVDSKVLEKGRTINRDFFYELLATMLVDKDLNSDFDKVEKHMLMALAVANNFHNMDVKMNDCYLNANNASEYHYHVTAAGKDDTWIADYVDRTFYFNDGKTVYSSDMFKDEYLAVWLMAIDDYYGFR